MPERETAIVVDSGASITPSLAEEVGLNAVIPLTVIWEDGTSTKDGEIPPETFYEKMGKSKELPTTSACSSGEAEKIYSDLYRQGYKGIVSLHISSKLSGTHNAASGGATLAMETNDGLDIKVVDTLNVSAGTLLLAQYAAELADKGLGPVEIEIKLQEAIDNDYVQLRAALETLNNLVKGGRVPAAKALAARLLNIKPTLSIQGGELHPTGNSRTMRRAVNTMIAEVEAANPVRVAVLHANNPADAANMADRLFGIVPHIDILEAGPAIGSHAGEKALGLAWITREP